MDSQVEEERIRVLIVDDIPETRENLRKLLYFETDIEVVGAAVSGEDGIEQAKELQPDIVLMDINMPGVDGIAATEAICREVAGAQVVMMSVQGEADYLKRSMLAGARDFLIKPFSSDELIATIRRVYEVRPRIPAIAAPAAAGPTPLAPTPVMPSREGKIVAIFSPKGGTGCSTIATNLAIAIQDVLGKKVVLLDASLQFGDVGVLLNLQPTRTIADLAPHTDELDSDMVNSVTIPHQSGIKVLLAPTRPEFAELITPDGLKKILDEMKAAFEYVVVDTGSLLDDKVLTVLDAASLVILIMTQDIPSIKNARTFFDVADELEYPPEKTLLVINKADRRKGLRAEDIEQSIRHPIAAQIALDDRLVPLSVNKGVPFVTSDRSSTVTQNIVALAQRVVEELEREGEEVAIAAVDEKAAKGFRLFR